MTFNEKGDSAMSGDAAKVLQSQGIHPCMKCKWAMLPYKLDDFHMNAQCHAPQNRTIKVSPVTHTEYPEYKAQFCKDTRSRDELCGPKGEWFESNTPPAAEETPAKLATREVSGAEAGRRSKASR